MRDVAFNFPKDSSVIYFPSRALLQASSFASRLPLFYLVCRTWVIRYATGPLTCLITVTSNAEHFSNFPPTIKTSPSPSTLHPPLSSRLQSPHVRPTHCCLHYHTSQGRDHLTQSYGSVVDCVAFWDKLTWFWILAQSVRWHSDNSAFIYLAWLLSKT